jgi:hypothetical protein
VNSKNSNNEELGGFFDLIWGSDQGLVYIPVKTPEEMPDSKPKWEKAFFRWPQSREHVIEHVLVQDMLGKEVYFSPVLWNKNTIEKSSVKQTRVVWADFDGNAPTEWPENPTNSLPGHPSVVIQSSTDTHQHVYWRLDAPNSDVDWIQNTNRSIAYSCSADTSGWDVEQILRPPFTTNHKRKLPVLVASVDDVAYSASSFATFSPIKQLVSESINEKNLPNPVTTIGKYIWSTEDLDLLNKEIPEGSRSSAYMRIGYSCAEKGLNDEEAYSVLLYLDDRIGKFRNRSDRKRRLLDIINKAKQKYPHAIDSPTFAGLTDAVEVEQDIQYFFGFSEFVNADFHVEWSIENLMPLQGCGLIVSPPGTGKSQFMMQLALHHALNSPFVGYKFIEELSTIFFSLEMPRAGIHQIARLMAEGYSPPELRQVNNLFQIAALGEPMYLTNPEARKFFEGAIEKYQPKTIIIDSLQKATSGSLSDDEAIRALFNYIASLRAKYGLCVWFIHHNRKGQGDNKKPRELDDVYGSRFITSEPDVVLSLWGDRRNKNVIEVSELKNRYAEARDDFYIERKSNLTFERQLEGLIGNNARVGQSVPDRAEPDRPSINNTAVRNNGFGFAP